MRPTNNRIGAAAAAVGIASYWMRGIFVAAAVLAVVSVAGDVGGRGVVVVNDDDAIGNPNLTTTTTTIS